MTRPGTSLAERMDGLLFFPVTPFGADGEVDLHVYRQHLRTRLAAGPAAVFACCGTGEFFSLGVEEYGRAVEAAVEVADRRVPVVAGVGYGTALAGAFADAAAEAGADGLLAMPPYLADGGQAGLLAHYQVAGRPVRARCDHLPAGQRDSHPADRGGAGPAPADRRVQGRPGRPGAASAFLQPHGSNQSGARGAAKD